MKFELIACKVEALLGTFKRQLHLEETRGMKTSLLFEFFRRLFLAYPLKPITSKTHTLGRPRKSMGYEGFYCTLFQWAVQNIEIQHRLKLQYLLVATLRRPMCSMYLSCMRLCNFILTVIKPSFPWEKGFGGTGSPEVLPPSFPECF